MRGTEFLNKTLSYAEYETAKVLYDELTRQKCDPAKAAALIYRCGFLDGRDNHRQRIEDKMRARQAYIEQKAAKKAIESQPEAIIEGSGIND